jgi:ectoine hydroxylase-related dioxygenase (phytanoyl-CoA dioxygenase family)
VSDRCGELEQRGYVVVPDVLTFDECDAIAATLPAPAPRRGGVRNLIGHSAVLVLLQSPALIALSAERIATNATLFDKSANANWKVPWHQDRVIRGEDSARIEPAAEVLESMFAIRLHLDDCAEENGPLRVIAGSHRGGKLTSAQIATIAAAGPVSTLPVKKGAAIIMRPLLVHASSVAKLPSHRRVLHLEFN